MDDTKTSWATEAGRIVNEWQGQVNAAARVLSEHGQAIDHMPKHRAWLASLLLRGDHDLVGLLLGLNGTLRSWVEFDSLSVSRRHGKLAQHLEVQGQLTDAVCDLVDHLTTQAAAHDALRDMEKEVAHLPVTMHSNLLHILDREPVDEGCHRQMRDSIDTLMERVQFWREHPGEAYDGQQVADVLMPIITQLLEHEQQEVAR